MASRKHKSEREEMSNLEKKILENTNRFNITREDYEKKFSNCWQACIGR